MARKLLDAVEVDFLRVLYPRHTIAETTAIFNRHCRRRLTHEQIKNAAARLKIGPSAYDGRFRKGDGRSGAKKPEHIRALVEGGKVTRFKKGHAGVPSRTWPMFTERTRTHKRGYTEVFIKVPGPSPHRSIREKGWGAESHWIHKSVWVWTKAHGPVPKGHVVIHLDGDRLNCELWNLDCVSRGVLARLNAYHAPKYAGKEMNPARIRLAQTREALSRRKDGENGRDD